MKAILISIILFIANVLVLFSQNYPRDPGNISQEEFNLSFYAKDPDAAALVLYDKGESEFFESANGYDIRFTRKKRIKIFNSAGFEFSEITIPFYAESFNKTEKVNVKYAVTYNYEDNKVVSRTLDNEAVYEITINERWKAKTFAFPNVKEGSILEFEYTLETPFHFNLPDWKFQDMIPTLYSEYTVKLIPFYDYQYFAQNISKFDVQRSVISPEVRTYGSVNLVHGKNYGTGFEFREIIHTFVKRDIPAFYDESYITSKDDYIMKIDFQLERFNKPSGGSEEVITTWPKLIKYLIVDEKFGKYLSTSRSYAKKIIKTLPDLDNATNMEKCISIIQYVRSNLNWNGRSDKFTTRSPKDLLSQKTGSSADINLFLIAMLNEAGIKSDPVIISTRNHGKIKADYPFHHFFNYVVALVNVEGNIFLTDGTDNHIPYNRIPIRCINDKGLLIDKKQVNWVELNSTFLSLNKKDIKLTINPDNFSSNAVVSIQSTEYEASKYKGAFKNDTVQIKSRLMDNGFLNVSEIQTYNYDNNTLPYVINFNAELKPDVINERILISPFLNFPEKENKLKQPSRTYPVDFIYSRKEEFKSMIFLPEGYKPVTLPEEVDLNNDLFELKVNYVLNDEWVEANAIYTLKRPVYYSKDYSQVKKFLDMVVEKLNEQLVLVKN